MHFDKFGKSWGLTENLKIVLEKKLHKNHAVQRGIVVPTQHCLAIGKHHGKNLLLLVAGTSGCLLPSSLQTDEKLHHPWREFLHVLKPQNNVDISLSVFRAFS
jgi:hypothetical protein